MEKTLVIIKPDAVERGLAGEIISRLTNKGLKIVACELRLIDKDLARRHYKEHEGKTFYDELVDFITRSPSFVMVLEGPGETWKIVRNMMGATDPAEAAPGTIRGDLALEVTENLIHGSDSQDAAQAEIELFFPQFTKPAS
ncbi:MAG: nucleoside-diphosphate kinase [Actinobacteria bacterium]|nr:nucleoside-diphosphate kinase [Actinomycetota bacterium]MCL6105355.1 nucleoside-diphosphate kinase [Actinomycetota bacterium]